MEKLRIIFIAALSFCAVFAGCDDASYITDIDGNVYKTVTIGDQEWMAENLKTSTYDNGDSIPNITDDTEWSSQTEGVCCSYDNDKTNELIYGKLYNWYAAVDSRNVCPSGWHVPSDDDWIILVDSQGGYDLAGAKLKSTGTLESFTGLWKDPNTDADNVSGFSGRPGGYRFDSGGFSFINEMGAWRTSTMSTERPERGAWSRFLNHNNTIVFRGHAGLPLGLSVRCVKD